MFGKRFHIMTVAGFNIGLDISWFFIALLLTWTLAEGYFPYYFPNLNNGTYWLMGFLGMLGLFVSIVLHEMGHSVVARHYQVPISQITLFIFGGVAEMKKEPNSPLSEFLVAIAGPIVSVIIFVCMYLLTLLGKQLHWPVMVTAVTGYLAFINAVVVVFNLIPAFPLDGGRILRSILWGATNNLAWATKIATVAGSIFGYFLIFLGIFSFLTGNLFSGIWWVILGIFLAQAAASTRTQYYVKHELENETVAKFMTKDPFTVTPETSIKDFVEQYVYHSYHHLYPVTQEGRLLGYISLKEVKSISHSDWPHTLVKQLMVPVSEDNIVSPDTNAMDALNVINQTDTTALLVVSDGHLVGILTAQDLFKLISLKLELEEKSR
jgi:Zn-dependent protease/CBS domain-containing protein